MESWTISRILDWTTDYFKKYSIEWPHLEAEILLSHCLDKKRIELYTEHEKILSPGELSRYKELIKRRSKKEPIAYITGIQPFMSLEFIVDRSVLIPRPETEKLVEIAIDALKIPNPLIADIGTGSGAIAISLAKYIPEAKVIGVDSSPAAVNIARKNAERHNVSNRCDFRPGDLFSPLKEKVDMIVSNPPYIPSAEIESLETDVKDWEPIQALDGGADGLDLIRKIISLAPDHLNTGGRLILEFGIGQAEAVLEMARERFSKTSIVKDYAGKERLLMGEIS